jgi:hypothetical protein
MTTNEMRQALPEMILSLTEAQVELVLLAINYVRQGMDEETAILAAYADMSRELAS